MCPPGLAVLAVVLNPAKVTGVPEPPSPETERPRRRAPGFSADSRSRAPRPAQRGGRPSPQGPTTPPGRAGAAPRPTVPESSPGPRPRERPQSRSAAGLPPQLAVLSHSGAAPTQWRVSPVPAAFETSRGWRRSGTQTRHAAAALEPAAYRRKGSPRGGFHRAVDTPREFPTPPHTNPNSSCKFPPPVLSVDKRQGGGGRRGGGGGLRSFLPTPGPRPPPPSLSPRKPSAVPEGTRRSSASSASSAEGGAARAPPGRARLFPCAAAAHSALGGAGWLPGCESSVGGGCCCLWPGRLGEAECW